MAIVRWEPARELGSLQQEVNRVFSSFFEPTTGGGPRWAPPIDLLERQDHYLLLADLPGVDEEALTVEVDGDTLTVAGSRDVRPRIAEGEYLRAERPSGEFRRQLSLPDGIDAGTIQATFDDGVLEVRIPKPEQAVPTRVSIDIGSGTSGAAKAPIDGDATSSEDTEATPAPTGTGSPVAT